MDIKLPDVMDTTTLSEQGVTLAILRPDNGEPLVNEGKAVAVTVYGPDSKAFQNADTENNKARVAASLRGEEWDATRANVEMLSRITKSWTGILDKAGQLVNCTPDHAAALYSKFPVIRDQVANFVTNRRNFIKASPNASSASRATAGA